VNENDKRYCCLACGRFWAMSNDERPACCPYCGDQWFNDNCLPDVPPWEGKPVDLPVDCAGEEVAYFTTDGFTGDVRFCPFCGEGITPPKRGTTRKEFLLRRLEALGL